MPKALIIGDQQKTNVIHHDFETNGYQCRCVSTIAEAVEYLAHQPSSAQIVLLVQQDAAVTSEGGRALPAGMQIESGKDSGKQFVAWVREQNEMVSPDMPVYIVAVDQRDASLQALPENTYPVEFGNKPISQQIRPRNYNSGINPARAAQR